MVTAVRPQVQTTLTYLEEAYEDRLTTVAADISPCDRYEAQKHETFLLLTVLRRAFVAVYTD